MTQRTIDHFYPTYVEAVEVVADLTAAGISATDVSLIESETDARLPQDVATDTAQNPAVTGATLGAAIGAGIGALDGVGAIAIPFTDPLVATGWVLPCVVFAIVLGIVGAIVGAVTRLGVRNKEAHTIASQLQRGQHLVMVRVEEVNVPTVEAILNRPRTRPPGQRGPEPVYSYEQTGDMRTPSEEAAAIHRAEQKIQFEGSS